MIQFGIKASLRRIQIARIISAALIGNSEHGVDVFDCVR